MGVGEAEAVVGGIEERGPQRCSGLTGGGGGVDNTGKACPIRHETVPEKGKNIGKKGGVAGIRHGKVSSVFVGCVCGAGMREN